MQLNHVEMCVSQEDKENINIVVFRNAASIS